MKLLLSFIKKTRVLLFIFVFSFFFALFGKQVVLFAQQALGDLPYINMSDKHQNSGGLISMSSEEEPAISLGSWDLSGEVTLKLYKADDRSLIEYLVHDKENKQVNPNVDVNKFEFITEFKTDIQEKYENRKRVDLPLEESGIWYLTLESNGSKNSAFIVRSKNGLIVQESKDNLVVWGQKLTDLKRLNGGLVTLYDMEDSIKVISEETLDSDGLTELSKGNSNVDIVVLRHEGDIAIAPINLQYLNVGYSYQRFRYETDTTHFVFTDRPVYKPGGNLYFKSILRDDDDARYSPSQGLARVIIHKAGRKEEKVLDKYYPINANGSIDGEFKIPESISTGYYNIFVTHESEDIDNWGSGKSASFSIEHYRKPEYFLEVESSNIELVKGDKAEYVITGQYFSGKPLANQLVEYTVSARDAYDSTYLRDSVNSNDNPYFSYGGKVLFVKSVELDSKGKAVISIDTEELNIEENKTKILKLSATFIDNSGNPVNAVQNAILYPGEFSIYRSDYLYTGKVNKEYELKLKLTPHGNVSVNNITIDTKISRSWWDKNADSKYEKHQEEITNYSTKSNSDGEVIVKMTPTDPGSYTFTVNATDQRGNTVTKKFGGWIRDSKYNYFSDYYGSGSNDLVISTDREAYQPGDTAKLYIQSDFPQRDVLLSMQRSRVDRYQVVSINDNSSVVDLPIIDDDMPNTYARVSSFNNHNISTHSTKILVPANKKRIQVSITPDQQMYGPGQTAVVNILTQDVKGNPVPAEVTLWSVDKAIYELSDSKTEDIFDTFWKERYGNAVQAHSLEGIRVDGPEGGGGCFLENTQVLMEDGSTKFIQDIVSGDKILTQRSEEDAQLVSAKVNNTHIAEVGGYIIINENLKVTPDHLIYLNGLWQEIGNAQIGDTLRDTDGESIKVESLEWIQGKKTVYNLEIDKYHTYIANGVWVHNDKGDSRSVFKDTAYWNPSIKTDSDGRAQVIVPLPDNLTTWVFAGVASTASTQVGQSTAEVQVSKDVVVRPIMPNMLRAGDRIDFTALLHNFTDKDQLFEANIEFEGAEVVEPNQSGIKVGSSED